MLRRSAGHSPGRGYHLRYIADLKSGVEQIEPEQDVILREQVEVDNSSNTRK